MNPEYRVDAFLAAVLAALVSRDALSARQRTREQLLRTLPLSQHAASLAVDGAIGPLEHLWASLDLTDREDGELAPHELLAPEISTARGQLIGLLRQRPEPAPRWPAPRTTSRATSIHP